MAGNESGESPEDGPAEGTAAEVEGPAGQPPTSGLASVERVFLRLTFWQTLLSLAGVFTGAVALYAALSESQAVREQTAASVWPYVQMMIDDTDDGSSARFSLTFENVGVGPAKMRGLRLLLAGEPVLTWDDASRRLLGEAFQVGVDYGRSSVSRRVIAPGESVVAFQTKEPALARGMQGAMYGGAVALSYCFCSIFEQCWLAQIPAAAGGDGITAVAECPDFSAAAFRD